MFPPRPARRRAAREGCWWRERPPFLARWCGTRGGGAPSTAIPAGTLKSRTRIVLLNLALIAAGLRAWLSPWPAPGEAALPDLVGATDPLVQVTRPVVHQDTPALEQVRTRIGRLDPVADHMSQGRLDHFPGMVRQPNEFRLTYSLDYIYVASSS